VRTLAAASGLVSFSYKFEIFHAWYDVKAYFLVFAETEEGTQEKAVVDFANLSTTGPRTFEGSVSFPVEKGRAFGFKIGGSNFDSNSTLQGTLTVSQFRAPLDGEPAA